jgi:GNAT superfamily N-acetyltransferase
VNDLLIGSQGPSSVAESGPTALASGEEIVLRAGGADDLEAVNRVIETAVMGWDLPDRLKRLSLPLYRYTPQDLVHLNLLLAVDWSEGVVGVAAVEPAEGSSFCPARSALLLHGLYVTPRRQGKGIGGALLNGVTSALSGSERDGLLVKAHSSAAGFFEAQGFVRLPVSDARRDYPHSFWLERLSTDGSEPQGRGALAQNTKIG